MGILQKAGNFLGVNKFAQSLAGTVRVLSGSVAQDIKTQEEQSNNLQKITYAFKNEQDPERKARLRQLMETQLKTPGLSATEISSELNLTPKEIYGSAANVALNIATPGAFKGSKAAVLAKNAALGGGFGAASGLEKNRDISGIAGSTVGGALVGTAIGGAGMLAKAAKDFVGTKVPEWMMNKAVRPALEDLKKNVKFGTKTLGRELLDEGVKGGPKKLLEIADTKLSSLEDDLQRVLTNPEFANKVITKDKIAPYLTDLIEQKAGTPGMSGDVQRIKKIFDSVPESMTISEANLMKRRIYKELRDVSYKLDAKLNTKANVLRQVATALKTEIEDTVGGNIVKDINKKLSIYGRLENSMVDQLAREMRNNGIGLTDAILLAGGDTTSILALLRHLGTGMETNVAQGLSKIQKIGTGKVGQATGAIIKRGALNIP